MLPGLTSEGLVIWCLDLGWLLEDGFTQVSCALCCLLARPCAFNRQASCSSQGNGILRNEIPKNKCFSKLCITFTDVPLGKASESRSLEGLGEGMDTGRCVI